ncbi:PREDICTED: SHC SH2 domain-binding protein 1 homolog B [Nicrophorus vespilloides]|uniref:SHC SH2 domain-binding protein 1 homolog B n=1 Tax=Nicrophorus vespilloides TaxID=110193 RepID=A0ABM1MI90_NICVS|nr:PREDICTED: SHC SH2 domain-binding protein 1 homolog B [Nicrophorus vespilloides]
MDQVITYDKSLQQRLQEYLDVYSSSKIGTVNQIRKEWGYYLEFSLDPNGWQAIWKIPRISCENLKIPFPTIVLVYIEDVSFNDLSAVAKIIAVQDDISLPEKHFVPLMQLWPTKDQDKTVALNMQNTSNSLDMYRFFYTNIFMPWDYDDDNSDWLQMHLETRLRLYYDMKNGVIPRSVAEHIRSLLTDARKLHARREQIELDLSDIDEENTNDERIQTLMDLNVQIIQIKSEVELLENPVTRNVIIKRSKDLTPEKKISKPQFWLVFEEGKIDEYFEFLNKVKMFHPNETFKFSPRLSTVLETFQANDTVILSKSLHSIRSVSGLENGGCLKGIYDKENTTLSLLNEDVILDFMGQNVVLENITINAACSQCAILVRAGKTVLKHCKLIGDNHSSTHQGIIVLKGAQLELVNCELSGFCTAIVGNSGSNISIANTEIFDVNYGVKIYDYCTFKAENCTFHDCKEYGLCVETNKTLDQKVGNFEVLQIIPDVSIKDLNGKNNTKGNVLINQKTKITPMTDLFSNPKNDPTIKHNSETSEDDVDMNDGDVTIIERNVDMIEKAATI